MKVRRREKIKGINKTELLIRRVREEDQKEGYYEVEDYGQMINKREIKRDGKDI